MDDLGQSKGVQVDVGDIQVDKSSPIPAVTLSPGLKERLASNMRQSIVVNLLGRSIRYTILCAKLRQLWDMRGAKVVDMGEGFFLVQFASSEAYNEAMLEGPWTVLGSYLQVQSWSTAFRVQKASPLSTAVVWIRISDLPLHLYPSNVISAIGGAVGKVMKVDYNTSGMQRGKFARLAVNIDLSTPLVSKLTIDGEEFKVEYENLNLWLVDGGGEKEEVVRRRRDENERNEAAQGGSSFHILREDDEVGRDNGVHATTVDFDTWFSRVERADETIHKSKNGTPAAGSTSYDSLLNSEGFRSFKLGKNKSVSGSSRNTRSTKTTFGDFFDYTRKTQLEKVVVPKDSTLDSNATMMEPVVVSRETTTLGRPPDEKVDAAMSTAAFGGNESMNLDATDNRSLCERALKTLIGMYNVHAVALLEPHISGEQADRTIRRIGFPNSHRVEAHGFSGDFNAISQTSKRMGGSKKRLLSRLAGVQKILEFRGSHRLLALEAELERDLDLVLQQEESLWHQKSWSDWIQLGDRNTSFFHMRTIRRLVDSRIVEVIGQLFNHAEIKKALFAMKPWKAPGVDGIQAGFYQQHWDVVGEDICVEVLGILTGGVLDRRMNRTMLCLIPKIKAVDASYYWTHPIHSMQRKTGKKSVMDLKVDLEKAYDRFNANSLEWEFNWLGHGIEYAVREGEWKPFRLCKNGPPLTHLFFADDLLLFGQTGLQTAEAFSNILEEFCASSGMKMIGKGTYTYILDRMKEKIASWSSNQISFAGRITLAQAVLNSMPLYAMHTSSIPLSTCEEIEKAIRGFVWGSNQATKCLSKVAWSKIKQRKEKDGLGFRDLHLLNVAFGMKACWEILKKPESFWDRLLCAKYKFEPSLGFDLYTNTSCTSFWRLVCSSWTLM
ncbi:hypothetical protein SASPL_136245 [Salvia splendens]|uniref:DUF4283 domain-containing protein n=1 Tax=Salvia splendens TaxID=180675 RepID=A0A8X8X1S4_SALSN|nr:hypothetical protein SASPL_136245 [Salvia splendens]